MRSATALDVNVDVKHMEAGTFYAADIVNGHASAELVGGRGQDLRKGRLPGTLM
jgi:hypothetical protein